MRVKPVIIMSSAGAMAITVSSRMMSTLWPGAFFACSAGLFVLSRFGTWIVMDALSGAAVVGDVPFSVGVAICGVVTVGRVGAAPALVALAMSATSINTPAAHGTTNAAMARTLRNFTEDPPWKESRRRR